MPDHPIEKITLLLADDHPLIRTGIRAALSQASDIEIVGEAQNGGEVKQMVARLHPRILLLDLKMPDLAPAQLERWVQENYPETVTLVLTQHDRNTYLARMMDAGAAGYLSKEGSAEQLIGAIRRAARGELLFDAEQIERARHWRSTEGKKWDSLTERERAVLRLLAQGLDNKSIANSLHVSLKTIEYHNTNLLRKLDLASRQEAAEWLHEHFPEDTENKRG